GAGRVRFDNRNGLIKRKGRQRVGGVFANPRQFLHFVDPRRKSPAISIQHEFRGRTEISLARVVAEPLPGAENRTFSCAGESREAGEAAQPLFIIRQHRCDLRLLKHELGNENGVGIAGAAPGKIATVFVIPTQQSKPEFGSNHSKHSTTKDTKGTKNLTQGRQASCSSCASW